LIVIFAAIIVAASFGFSYGNVGNQATYLPHALNHLDPAFLQHDWLVTKTTPYHSQFLWIVWAASAVGSVGWSLAILHVILVAASLYLIYMILRQMVPTYALPAFFIAVALIFTDNTIAVAKSYLFSDGMQPSVLASFAWLAALLFFLQGRSLASGVVLALGGLFHANFLLLGIGAFGLAQMGTGQEKLGERLCRQVLPSILLLLPSLPLILSVAGGDGAALSRDIFLRIRSPHHYLPVTFLTDFLLWGGWALAGIGATLSLPASDLRQRLLALIGSFALSVAGATLLTTAVFIPSIAQLFVWRIAPFGTILCQMAVIAYAFNLLADKTVASRVPNKLGLALMLFGGLCVLRWFSFELPLTSFRVLGLVVALGSCVAVALSARYLSESMGRKVLLLVTCLCVLVTLPNIRDRMTKAYDKSSLLDDRHFPLYNWARTTPENSVFLVPPEVEELRLLGKRAVVVDWKSTPIKPDELIAWYRRLQQAVGAPIDNYKDAVRAYGRLSLPQLRQIAQQFGASHIVVDHKTQKGNMGSESPLYDSGQYAVYSAVPASH
jgi:hypothetical protein